MFKCVRVGVCVSVFVNTCMKLYIPDFPGLAASRTSLGHPQFRAGFGCRLLNVAICRPFPVTLCCFLAQKDVRRLIVDCSVGLRPTSIPFRKFLPFCLVRGFSFYGTHPSNFCIQCMDWGIF